MQAGGKHIARRNTHLDAFGLRHGLPDKQDGVSGQGEQHRGKLSLPSQTKFAHEVTHESTDHNTPREPNVELIEFGGFVVWIQGRNQRIAGGFDGTVGDPEQKRATKQAPVIPRKNRQQDAGQVTHKSQANNPPHSDGITQRTAEHHGQSEAPERGAVDPAHLLVGQSEFFSPRAHGRTTNGEAHGGDNQGQTTGIEQTGSVGRS